ncbi:YqcI/YcgG family protein (plasmid) [Skermanella mucosa]|uniref:guanitoxin biosynthesis heme-dependent pre-guanitoxin N-hydroxylase GntA n=1 Tax=Skermanella mucosa TaxID=1789672 RepID=UPI00192C194E|nr:guanitoxin biosynthesis heme-dependent pre-guanitoxin N-hydroxylase GntA [Skermanella mucosa]UEM24180.1 YqcI/YcgG family protein [Skermanella mucosa]
MADASAETNGEQFTPEADIREFILDQGFPCVGAKSAVQKGRMTVYTARSIESSWDDVAIQERLMRFAWEYTQDPTLFTSFAVVFQGPAGLAEEDFERNLWDRVQSLTDKDAWQGQRHDPRVSADPNDPHFALSFGGQAFFVVGLHPRASRPARRFRHPAMIFNLHDQFQMLRDQDRYEKLRAAILDRDVKLAGDVNPMLARHGESSEARQYSGRIIEPDWACPYSRKPAPAARPRPLDTLQSFLGKQDA